MKTEINKDAAKSQSVEAAVSPTNWVESKLLSLNNQYRDDSTAEKKDKETSRKRLYSRVAAQWKVTEEILSDKERMNAFMLDATRRGISTPKEDENLFLMFIRMYDGWFEVGSTSIQSKQSAPKWKFSRSSEKYAGVLRWLHQNPDKIRESKGDIVKIIESYDGSEGIGKKIGGIIAADREANGQKRTVITAESFRRLRALPLLSLLPIKEAGSFRACLTDWRSCALRSAGGADVDSS